MIMTMHFQQTIIILILPLQMSAVKCYEMFTKIQIITFHVHIWNHRGKYVLYIFGPVVLAICMMRCY